MNDGLDKKMSNESNRQHLRRVDRVIEKKKQEAAYAKKYNIQIIRDEKSGEIKIKNDPASMKKKQKIDKEKLKKMIEEAKKAKKLEILNASSGLPLVKYHDTRKKKNNKVDKDEIVIQQDYVKFGEVVKEPPSFKLPQKENAKASKTGRRDFLFLKKFE
jgi:hypothetical protein